MPTDRESYTVNHTDEMTTSADGHEVYTAPTDGMKLDSGDTIVTGTAYYIRKAAEDNHNASDWTVIIVAARAAAHGAAVTVTVESLKDHNDGKLTGLTTASHAFRVESAIMLFVESVKR